MADDRQPRITIAENGPYVVYGPLPVGVESIVPNEAGQSWSYARTREIETGERYALCRCGKSEKKPFCDGAHARADFDGSETASRAPFEEQAEVIPGPALTLHDAKPLCAWARFCDNGGTIWKDIAATQEPATRELVEREAGLCPSGRLVVRDGGRDVEPAFEPPSVALLQDPAKNASGPIFVRGGVTIVSSDGTVYERRNRVTLCRCGASANKPFCDGSHVDVAFTDGLAG